MHIISFWVHMLNYVTLSMSQTNMRFNICLYFLPTKYVFIKFIHVIWYVGFCWWWFLNSCLFLFSFSNMFQEGEQSAQENGMFFIETSAKNAYNINELFYEIGKLYISLSINPATKFCRSHFLSDIWSMKAIYKLVGLFV